jgi:uncharacterized membrane protein
VSHGSDFERLIGPDRRRIPRPNGLAALVVIIALATVAGLVALYPRDLPDLDLTSFGFTGDVLPGTVLKVATGPCSYSADLTCNYVQFEVEDETGSPTEVQEFPAEAGQPSLNMGDKVFMARTEADDGTVSYYYVDRDRAPLLIALTVLFALAVIGLARWRGVAALGGLVVSVLILVGFIVPAIIAGEDPVLVATVGGSAIVLVALYLAHGYNPLTHSAALGAFGALALTAFLSWAALAVAKFTGVANEEASYLLLLPGFDISGLLLAGIVLGAIGALDDVTVTQASTVWELRDANPNYARHDLFASGLRVGRDHIASTVNTLLLAYAGAAMPLMILFTLSGQSLGTISSSEVVAVEITRTLVGSIGLVAAVPLTTWLAAREASIQPRAETTAPEEP